MIFIFFLISVVLSFILTPLIQRLALKFKIVDWPEIKGRKIHQKPIPLLGGLVIFLSFFIILLIAKQTAWWPVDKVLNKHLIAMRYSY